MSASLPLTAALLGASFLLPPLLPQQHAPDWSPAGWEAGFQEAWNADTRDERETAAHLSDAGLNLSLGAGIGAVVLQGFASNGDEALAFGEGAARALALNAALTTLSKRLAGRARPYAADGNSSEDSAYQSFFSGHASYSFLGAAVACRAAQWPGQSTPDWLCPAALATAGATSFLRVRADRHYVSDIFVGALVGAASGWFLTPGPDAGSRNATARLVPTASGLNIVLGF